MGLLSGFTNFVEHPIQGLLGAFRQPTDGGAYFDQNGQLIGNGGDASRPYVGQGGPAPMPPQLAGAPQRQPGFLSSLAKLPGAYVNDLLNDAQAGPRKSVLEDQIRQQIAQTVTDPQERAVAMANPTAWAKEKATLGAYHGINGGDVGVFGNPAAGGYTLTAPKLGENAGRGYSVGPNGMTSLGELPPAYDQITGRQNADTKAAELQQGRVVGPGGHLVSPTGQDLYSAPFAPRIQGIDPKNDVYQIGGANTAPTINVPQSLAKAFPSATVTSGARTPEHNAAVGGVPNSAHLTGQALDLVPPPQMSTAQFAESVKNSGIPLRKVIDEGSHVHVEWAADPTAQTAGPKLIKKGVAPAGAAGGLDDKTVENLAQQYAAGDKSVITSLGRNATGQADRTRVLNRSVEIMAGQGQGGSDAVANRSALAANQQALKKITTTRDQIKASEDTVAANMQIVVDLAPKGGGPTKSPLLNTPIQYARKNVWGDAQVSAFDNAIGTVADEYAKVMTTTSGAGGGVSSDSARKEAYSRLNKSANFAQLQANMSTMQKEMDNRVTAFNKQEDAILGRIKGQGAPAAAPPQKQLSPDEARKLPKGTAFTGLDGVRRVVR